ncbi:hypothetical protein DOTSEDRAFT_23659 [Dothistroma septosporum NZE10]|uniref:Ubiquitin-like domain-containing protein n=1 Tax=Dothistroma septosporum (strain NZE10 / CBS 128990) TaxID=675120 RepID=N1PQE4_DOTSN|nr:hypothetical protein DOTSEDRAFT_23659 [Dothistroma septosporum NZE10]
MDNNHRTTKDTNARKYDRKRGMHASIEMKAMRAYYDAKIGGYEEQLQSLEEDHRAEIAQLKPSSDGKHAVEMTKQRTDHETRLTQLSLDLSLKHATELEKLKSDHETHLAAHESNSIEKSQLALAKQQEDHTAHLVELKEAQDRERRAWAEKQRIAVAQVTMKAEADVNTISSRCQAEIINVARLKAQSQALRDSVSQANEAAKTLRTKVRAKNECIDELKKDLKKATSNRQSFIEIHFRRGGEVYKSYVFRPGEAFATVARLLAKDKDYVQSRLAFRHNGEGIDRQDTETLEELGIGSGDHIDYWLIGD